MHFLQKIFDLAHRYRFYSITGGIFLTWVFFIDTYSVFTQIGMYRQINSLENEVEFYDQKIKQTEAQQKEVLGSPQLVEKFARERYLMKKPKETVYVLVNKDNKPIEK
jgi:cell division protein DivIC